MLRFHTQTAGCSATGQQPENNIVRVAYEALSAVLGGTQSLHTNSMDEVLALPTEKSVEIALRTQQVLAYETNVTNVADRWAFVLHRSAHQRMERQALDYFRQIEDFGGVIEAIEAGFFQREIADASYRYQRSLEAKDRVVVGVNGVRTRGNAGRFELAQDRSRDRTRASARGAVGPRFARRCCGGSRAGEAQTRVPLRRKRDAGLIEACRALATEGEIVDAMADVFGRYIERASF